MIKMEVESMKLVFRRAVLKQERFKFDAYAQVITKFKYTLFPAFYKLVLMTINAIISSASTQIHRIRRGANQHQVSHANEIQTLRRPNDFVQIVITHFLPYILHYK